MDCPKCGTEINDYQASERYGDERGYPFTCRSCGFEGEEIYSEIFIGFVDTDKIWVKPTTLRHKQVKRS